MNNELIKGTWFKIGEVTKYKAMSLFKDTYCTYAVFEFIKEDGMRMYKEVYMASDTYNAPKLNCQKS